jgi:hypothetical protein
MLFSLPAGTEMFHFPAFPPHTLCIQMRVTRHDSGWVPPFGHPGITAWLTAPPGLSRPPTSFIGSWCQGIHRLPLKTYLHRETKMLASTMHISTNNQPTPTANTHTTTVAVCAEECDRRRSPKLALVPSGPNRVLNNQPNRTTARSMRDPKTPALLRLTATVVEPIYQVSPPLSPDHRIRVVAGPDLLSQVGAP